MLFTDQVTWISVLPVTVASNCVVLPAPMVTVLGLRVTTMFELATTSARMGAEVAEPGLGLVTVMLTLPTCAAVAVPVAVSSVGDTNVVVNCCVPKLTTEPFMKPEPVIVSKNLMPTTISVGMALVRTGTGLPRVMAALPEEVLSATLVAVTVTLLGFGIFVGAR